MYTHLYGPCQVCAGGDDRGAVGHMHSNVNVLYIHVYTHIHYIHTHLYEVNTHIYTGNLPRSPMPGVRWRARRGRRVPHAALHIRFIYYIYMHQNIYYRIHTHLLCKHGCKRARHVYGPCEVCAGGDARSAVLRAVTHVYILYINVYTRLH